MKIAIFSDNYLPGVGGTENAVKEFASRLCEKNEVILFCPDYHKDFDDSAYKYKTVRIKSVKVTKNDCASLPNMCKKTKRTLKEFHPDIVHTMTFGPISSFAQSFAKKNNIPVVSTVHTKYLFCYKRATHLKLLSKLIVSNFAKRLNGSKYVCSVSSDMKSELFRYGVNKEVHVIKNGAKRRNNSFEKPINKKFTCLFVGLIVKYKNIKFSLDALKKVKEKGYDFVFNIVGDGQDRKYFEKYVKKIGLEDDVNFLGRITDAKKIDKVYADSDLFLFPSVFDNDPLVVLEAGNMGTPSLTLENTGASERLIDGENGFTSKNDLSAFADKIIYLIENKNVLSKAGLNAKNLFTDWDENVNEYVKIYKKILKEG